VDDSCCWGTASPHVLHQRGKPCLVKPTPVVLRRLQAVQRRCRPPCCAPQPPSAARLTAAAASCSWGARPQQTPAQLAWQPAAWPQPRKHAVAGIHLRPQRSLRALSTSSWITGPRRRYTAPRRAGPLLGPWRAATRASWGPASRGPAPGAGEVAPGAGRAARAAQQQPCPGTSSHQGRGSRPRGQACSK
jgi:hypothetical protein